MAFVAASGECHFCKDRGIVAEHGTVKIGPMLGARPVALAICHDCAASAMDEVHGAMATECEDCYVDDEG